MSRKLKVRQGDLIRTRPRTAAPWSYGQVVDQHESGLIVMRDDRGRRRELTSVDGAWLRDNGNLEVKKPK